MKSEEYVYRKDIENKVETRIHFPGRKRFQRTLTILNLRISVHYYRHANHIFLTRELSTSRTVNKQLPSWDFHPLCCVGGEVMFSSVT